MTHHYTNQAELICLASIPNAYRRLAARTLLTFHRTYSGLQLTWNISAKQKEQNQYLRPNHYTTSTL